MIELHNTIARTVILFTLALGVWAGWSYFRKQGVSPSYFGAVVIGEGVMLVQGVLGLLLVLTGARPHDLLHFLYGFLVALGWPAVYIYTHARTTRAEIGWYALVAFFMFGLALRAVTTG